MDKSTDGGFWTTGPGPLFDAVAPVDADADAEADADADGAATAIAGFMRLTAFALSSVWTQWMGVGPLGAGAIPLQESTT